MNVLRHHVHWFAYLKSYHIALSSHGRLQPGHLAICFQLVVSVPRTFLEFEGCIFICVSPFPEAISPEASATNVCSAHEVLSCKILTNRIGQHVSPFWLLLPETFEQFPFKMPPRLERWSRHWCKDRTWSSADGSSVDITFHVSPSGNQLVYQVLTDLNVR